MSRAVATLPAPAHHDPDAFVLPHSIEAERATLGAALVNPHAADYIVDKLVPEAFFRRAHQVLFQAIRQIRDDRGEVDFVTLKEHLGRIGKLEEVGGPSYLSALADGMPRSTNVAHYAAILKDLHGRRALVAFANRTIDLVAAGGHSSSAVLNDTDRRLMDLQAGHLEGRMQSVSRSIGELTTDLDWRMSHRGELTGIDTGYPSINELTLGWQAGDLIIIGARPSIGKTTFVMNSAVHAARTYSADGAARRIAVFSLEMRRRQLEYRMLAQLAGVPLTRILNGYLGDADMPKMSEAMGALAELQIEIDDRTGQTVWDIRASCRRLKAEGGLDLAIVDYVQLVPGTLERRGATRNDEVTDISRRLKELADEISAPIVLLSQLSRKGTDRTDPRPKLSDLRESGALEQDADIVAFLHRKNHREGGTTNFIFEKQRNGPTGTVNLTLDRDIVTFTDGGEEPPLLPTMEKKGKRARSS